MGRTLHSIATALVVAICVLAIAGCGDSGTETIVRFADSGHASIDRSTLDHWMRAMAGGDLRRNLGTEGPAGLASEPADYPRCFAAAKLVAPRSFFNQIRYDRVQVTEKCRQLHRVIKQQALGFLISAHWTLAAAAARGLTATTAEVSSALQRARTKLYPTAAALRRYLTERQWSLADLLYQLKLNLLAAKLQTGSGEPATGESDLNFATSLASAPIEATAGKTICASGYVVPGCSEYRGPVTASSSAATVLEELTGKQPEATSSSH